MAWSALPGLALRGSGLAAWCLLLAQLLLGIVTAGNLGSLPRRRKLALHHTLSSAVLAVIAAHLALVLLTHHHGWTPLQVLTFQPGPLARNLGVAGCWLTVLAACSAGLVRRMVRQRLRSKVMKPVHRLAYLGVAAATGHAALAGPDVTRALVAVPAMSVLVGVGLAFRARLESGRAKQLRHRARAAGGIDPALIPHRRFAGLGDDLRFVVYIGRQCVRLSRGEVTPAPGLAGAEPVRRD